MNGIIKNLVKKLALSVINTAITIFILYWNVMAIANAFNTPDADWGQVLTYLTISIVILAIMWFISFLKFLRNLVLIILILLLCGWLYLPKLLPEIGSSMCVNMGSCKQGTEVKTVSGKIIINANTCKQKGWTWNAKKNTCETKIKK